VLVHLALVLHGASRHSAVFDEVVYPTSGYAYLTTGDYRMNPEHPPLVKLATGAAWLGTGLDARATPGWETRDQWLYGRSMIHGEGRPQALLMRARSVIALLSAALAIGIFVVARRLAGEGAALAAVTLYVFDPLVVAHAGYATTDLGGAALGFAAAVALPWALSHEAPRWAIVPAGLALGGALAAKFSNLPLLAVVAAVTATLARKASPGQRMAVVARAGGVVTIAAVTLTATYGPAGPWTYVRGVGMLGFHDEVGHPAYAFGRYVTSGWWWYFPAAWLVKTPIPILLATAAGVALALPRALRQPAWMAAMALPPMLTLGAAVASDLNIGVRHLLPIVPFLAVAGGAAAAAAWRRGLPARILVLALLGWLATGTLRVHPDETAYANETAGGADALWRRLADSNVDWGQDLPALRDAVGRFPLRRLYLGYFGTADPRAYGLRYCWISSMGMVDPVCEDGGDVSGREWIAISVTNLLDVYTEKHEVYAWLRERPFTAFPGRSIALFDVTGDGEAQRQLGISALRGGDPAVAEAVLSRAVEIAPEDAAGWIALAEALSRQGKAADAQAACARAEALRPGSCP
jgi:tetratricopeptide repeat protein